MLKEEIERIKKESPDGLEARRGGCRFCGQIASIEAPPEWGTVFCDELATECCGCVESTAYALKKKQKERAIKAIEKQFGEEAEEKEVQGEEAEPRPDHPREAPKDPHVGVGEGHQAHQKALPRQGPGGKEGDPVEKGEEGEKPP